MDAFSRITSIAFVTGSLLIITANSASAYIDPGTGSYMLQIVVAGALAAAFIIKSTWRNICQAVSKCFSRRGKDAE